MHQPAAAHNKNKQPGARLLPPVSSFLVHQLVLSDQIRAVLSVHLGVEVEPPPHDRPLLLLQVGLQAHHVGLQGLDGRRRRSKVVAAARAPCRLWGTAESPDAVQGVVLQLLFRVVRLEVSAEGGGTGIWEGGGGVQQGNVEVVVVMCCGKERARTRLSSTTGVQQIELLWYSTLPAKECVEAQSPIRTHRS